MSRKSKQTTPAETSVWKYRIVEQGTRPAQEVMKVFQIPDESFCREAASFREPEKIANSTDAGCRLNLNGGIPLRHDF